MQILSAIINNQWVITVLGGLLITLISTISSYIWTSRVSQKNLKKCQEEILSILEKVLTNDTELTEELLQSIVNSLIRKNNISIKRFFSNSELIEDVLVRLYLIVPRVGCFWLYQVIGLLTSHPFFNQGQHSTLTKDQTKS